MYNQNLNDAQLASLSVLSYSRWRPGWRRRFKTCVFSQVYVRFYIVIHVFRCFKSQQIHLERFQRNQSASFSAIRHKNNIIWRLFLTLFYPFIAPGESIPIRLFLSGYELTPTMKDINKKFSVRYYLNLVLVDEEERRYFKQQVGYSGVGLSICMMIFIELKVYDGIKGFARKKKKFKNPRLQVGERVMMTVLQTQNKMFWFTKKYVDSASC